MHVRACKGTGGHFRSFLGSATRSSPPPPFVWGAGYVSPFPPPPPFPFHVRVANQMSHKFTKCSDRRPRPAWQLLLLLRRHVTGQQQHASEKRHGPDDDGGGSGDNLRVAAGSQADGDDDNAAAERRSFLREFGEMLEPLAGDLSNDHARQLLERKCQRRASARLSARSRLSASTSAQRGGHKSQGWPATEEPQPQKGASLSAWQFCEDVAEKLAKKLKEVHRTTSTYGLSLSCGLQRPAAPADKIAADGHRCTGKAPEIGPGLEIDGIDKAPYGACLPFALAQLVMGTGAHHQLMRRILLRWIIEAPANFRLACPYLRSRRQSEYDKRWYGLDRYLQEDQWLGTESLMAAACRFQLVIICIEAYNLGNQEFAGEASTWVSWAGRFLFQGWVGALPQCLAGNQERGGVPKKSNIKVVVALFCIS